MSDIFIPFLLICANETKFNIPSGNQKYECGLLICDISYVKFTHTYSKSFYN
jgi:hypothetical protein